MLIINSYAALVVIQGLTGPSFGIGQNQYLMMIMVRYYEN